MRNVMFWTALATAVVLLGIASWHQNLVIQYVYAEQPTRIFFDDYESGTLSKWTGDDCAFGGSRIVTTERVHSGRFAMKSNLKGPAGCSTTLPTTIANSENVYVSFWVNWGDTYGCYGHWWRMYTPDGSQMDFLHGGANPCRSPGATKTLQAAFLFPDRDWSQFFADPFWNPTNTNTPTCPNCWHRVETLIRFNTPGQANGAFKIWIDGNLLQYAEGANIRGSSSQVFNRLAIQSNFDVIYNCSFLSSICDPNKDYYMYVDDVEWWTGCPPSGASCGTGDTTPPVPPRGIRIQ